MSHWSPQHRSGNIIKTNTLFANVRPHGIYRAKRNDKNDNLCKIHVGLYNASAPMIRAESLQRQTWILHRLSLLSFSFLLDCYLLVSERNVFTPFKMCLETSLLLNTWATTLQIPFPNKSWVCSIKLLLHFRLESVWRNIYSKRSVHTGTRPGQRNFRSGIYIAISRVPHLTCIMARMTSIGIGEKGRDLRKPNELMKKNRVITRIFA